METLKNPKHAPAVAAASVRIGLAIKAARKALRVSATTAAEAADISRVTLHRIERGDLSVNIGAYLRAADVLGVNIGAVTQPAQDRVAEPIATQLLDSIVIDQYPQLKMIAWSIPRAKEIKPQIALALYERNWRYVDQATMQPHERALLNQLIKEYGNGCLFI